MADSSYGERDIYIDLTATSARVIKNALLNELAIIDSITINGTSGAGAGDIVLRADSASGPIKHKTLAPGGTSFDGIAPPPLNIACKGLYMDALASAWTAGSFMLIHTR